jgi:hypothetical protein
MKNQLHFILYPVEKLKVVLHPQVHLQVLQSTYCCCYCHAKVVVVAVVLVFVFDNFNVDGYTKPSSTDLLHKDLYPPINQGIIDQVQSQLDKRQNIYFPVEEVEGNNNNNSTVFSL